MDLSKIEFPLHARGAWSAIDLGFALARQWWMRLFLVWLIPASIIYLAFLLIFPDRSWVGLLVAWWCKPFLDQLILYRASRLVFSENVTLRKTLRQMFFIVKTDWLWWLTLRRFSATRSFDMPVTTLESLRGGERQRRKSVLQLRNAGPAMWLTVLMVHLEYLLAYGVLGVVILMKPEHIEINWLGLLTEDIGYLRYWSDALTILIMASMAPFYTMAGFSLYLNRRIELEGWDIELRFQQIVSANSPRRAGTIIAGMMAGWIAWMPYGLEIASSHAATRPTPAESQELIQSILADDAFHEKHTISQWQRKDLETVEQDTELPVWVDFLYNLAESLAGSVKFVAMVFEVVLWLLVAAIVFYLIYRYRKDLLRSAKYFTEIRSNREVPEVMFGMPVSEESVPDDVIGDARNLWSQNQNRRAMSLLYRASLSRLLHRYECPFTPADTERDCVVRVGELGVDSLYRFMQQLTQAWQRIAYGHRELTNEDFERLCADWEAVLSR